MDKDEQRKCEIAFAEGAAAYRRGKDFDDDPYSPNHTLAGAWRRGYEWERNNSIEVMNAREVLRKHGVAA